MSQVSAAMRPITLGGKEYSLSRLSNKDHDELTQWVRASILKMARDLLSPEVDQETRDEVIGAAIRESRKITMWMAPECKPYFRSIEGVARIIYQGLKKAHPKLKYQDVVDAVSGPDDILEFNEAFADLNGVPDGEVKTQEEGSPK